MASRAASTASRPLSARTKDSIGSGPRHNQPSPVSGYHKDFFLTSTGLSVDHRKAVAPNPINPRPPSAPATRPSAMPTTDTGSLYETASLKAPERPLSARARPGGATSAILETPEAAAMLRAAPSATPIGTVPAALAVAAAGPVAGNVNAASPRARPPVSLPVRPLSAKGAPVAGFAWARKSAAPSPSLSPSPVSNTSPDGPTMAQGTARPMPSSRPSSATLNSKAGTPHSVPLRPFQPTSVRGAASHGGHDDMKATSAVMAAVTAASLGETVAERPPTPPGPDVEIPGREEFEADVAAEVHRNKVEEHGVRSEAAARATAFRTFTARKHVGPWPRPISAEEQGEILKDAVKIALGARPTQAELDERKKRVAPSEDSTLAQLTDIDECIAFFAESREVYTPVKFVYLRPPKGPPQEAFDPYTMQVQQRHLVDPTNYTVVTPTAVVHIARGAPAEVTPLHDFAREAGTFRLLRRLRFFQRYLTLKAFEQWRQNIRRKAFLSIRRRLSTAFVARGVYMRPLQVVKAQLAALSELPLLQWPSSRDGLAREQFARVLCGHMSAAVEKYDAAVAVVEQSLLHVVKAVDMRANVPDLATPEALEHYLKTVDEVEAREEGGWRRAGGKSMSMAAAVERRQRLMQRLKAAMEDRSALPHFIRLVDYMAAEALFRNAVRGVAALRDEFQRSGEHRDLFFAVAVSFDGADQGVALHPPARDVLASYDAVAEEACHSVGGVPRLAASRVLHNALGGFGQPPRVVTVADALRRDARVLQTFADTRRVIQSDFDIAAVATQSYAKNRRWFEYVSSVWPALEIEWGRRAADEAAAGTLMDAADAGAAPLQAADFQQVLDDVHSAFDAVQSMIAMRRGCLAVTAATILEFLGTKLRAIQAAVGAQLAAVAKIRLERLMQALQGRIRAIAERPTTLSKFAAFAAALAEVQVESKLITAIAEGLVEIYAIADSAKIDDVHPETARRELVLGTAHMVDSDASLRGTPTLLDKYSMAVDAAADHRQKLLPEMERKLMAEATRERGEVMATRELLDCGALGSAATEVPEALEMLESARARMEASEQQLVTYVQWQDLLGAPQDSLDPILELKEAHQSKVELWVAIDKWQQLHHDTYGAPLVEADITGYAKAVEDLLTQAVQRLHPQHNSDASGSLLGQLRQEKHRLPTLLHLGNKHMKPQHWAKILENQPRPYDRTMTLDSLRQMKVLDGHHNDVIAEQAGVAAGEAALMDAITAIVSRWETTDLTTKPLVRPGDAKRKSEPTAQEKRTQPIVLDDVDDISLMVDEDRLAVQGCLASRHVAAVRSQAEEWDRLLWCMSQSLEEWMYVQTAWAKLEYVFLSDDMVHRMPKEAEGFASVDEEFKGLMARADKERNCLAVTTDPGVVASLRTCRAGLDAVQSKIEEYLMAKRQAFPRFYFLSSDELLRLLADARDPRAVLPHLRKCFAGIRDLVFGSGTVLCIVSSEGEKVPLWNPVQVAGQQVEQWLAGVAHATAETLQHTLQSTAKAAQTLGHSEWIKKVQDAGGAAHRQPSQCMLAVERLQWTMAVEDALSLTNPTAALRVACEQFRSRVTATAALSVQTTPLAPLERGIVSSLIVVGLHHRDTLVDLVAAGVDSPSAFAWLQHLRFYFASLEDEHAVAASPGGGDRSIGRAALVARHGSAVLGYSYEYIGAGSRLVMTPLTDRAFLTMTSALRMNLGASPQGPAGTGKSESVKELAKTLGRQVIVFNCSEAIDAGTMARMFAGLAQGGAWACFDEFNRLGLGVLSVVAQQLSELTSAVARGLPRLLFDGCFDITPHPNFGVFITMNPGYTGRAELPDNLKALFRPVAMVAPDAARIAEVLSYAEGFMVAGEIGPALAALLSLAKDRLSPQKHYDFGLRTLRAVLLAASTQRTAFHKAQLRARRRQSRSASSGASSTSQFGDADTPYGSTAIAGLSPQEEKEIAASAAVEVIAPRLTPDDGGLFRALVRAVFVVDVSATDASHSTTSAEIRRAVATQLSDEGFTPVAAQLSKAVQVHQMAAVRSGVAIIGGPSLSGKTVLRSALKSAHDAGLGGVSSIDEVIVNPKALSVDELFGRVNPATGEWHDGFVAKVVRELVQTIEEDPTRRGWLVFDGPVDSRWVEDLNTVLDDSRLLCLASGERIQLPPTLLCFFEAANLRYVSPATVSRLGIVNVDSGDLPWTAVFESRADLLLDLHPNAWTDAHSVSLRSMFEAAIPAVSAASDLRQWVPVGAVQCVLSTFDLLEALLATVDDGTADDAPDVSTLAGPRAASTATGSIGGVSPSTGADAALYDAVVVDLVPVPVPPRPVPTADVELLAQMFSAFAVIWGCGGALAAEPDTRLRFDAAVRPAIRGAVHNFPRDATEGATVFDLRVHRGAEQWASWESMTPRFVFRRGVPLQELRIPSPEAVACRSVASTLLKSERSCLLVGPGGCGKSSLLQQVAAALPRDDGTGSSGWQVQPLLIGSATASSSVKATLESCLRRWRALGAHSFGPQAGKALALVMDDLHLPTPDAAGAAPSLETVRSVIALGGLSDHRQGLHKPVAHVVFAGALPPFPVKGAGEVEAFEALPRLISRACVVACGEPEGGKLAHMLGGFLRGALAPFAPDLRDLGPSIAKATVALLAACRGKLLPLPDKPQYVFALRQAMDIVRGIAMVSVPHCTTARELVDLWAHEAFRAVGDRLVAPPDQDWWRTNIVLTARQHFPLPALLGAPSWQVHMFSTLQLSQEDGLGAYRPQPLTQRLKDVLEEHMLSLGIHGSRALDLVLFDDAIRHLSRLTRVLQQPNGHALLLGAGGSGRQSLTLLAAYVTDTSVVRPIPEQSQAQGGASAAAFRDTLRQALLDAGCDDRAMCFLATDRQLPTEAHYDDLSCVLRGAALPVPWAPEDVERIMGSVRDAAVAAGRKETRQSLLAFFNYRAAVRLHVVIAISPSERTFRDRMRTFPSLWRATYVDWFGPWSEPARLAVARRYLNQIPWGAAAAEDFPASAASLFDEEVKEKIAELCCGMHAAAEDSALRFTAAEGRSVHITPASYVAALTLVKGFIDDCRDRVGEGHARYVSGLERLRDTNTSLTVMKAQMIAMRPQLDAEAAETARVAAEVAVEREKAEAFALGIQKEEAAHALIAQEAQAMRDECQAEIDRAMPAYHRSVEALNALNPKDLAETKAYTAPPRRVEVVLDAVLSVIDEPTGWDNARKVMSRQEFIPFLRAFDKDAVSEKAQRRLKKYVAMPDFTPEAVQHVSKACVSLCMWCRAIDRYTEVKKSLAPKQARLRAAEERLAAAMADLAAKRRALDEITAHLDELERAYDESTQREEALRQEMEDIEAKLGRAAKIMEGLGPEEARWEEQAAKLEAERPFALGSAVLAAGLAGYAGPLTTAARRALLARWVVSAGVAGLAIPDTDEHGNEFNPLTAVADPVLLRSWHAHGLPKDMHAVDSAVIAARSTRWCLFIDPEGQANKWLKRLHRDDGLKVVSPGDTDLLATLEAAMRVGTPVLMENVGETLDPALEPVLEKRIHRDGGRFMIRLQDGAIEYDPNFAFFMTTQLPNPAYAPDVQVRVTVLNFAVPFESATAQLLAAVVRHEQADLEVRAEELVLETAAAKAQLKESEDTILRLTAGASKEALVEDDSLGDALAQAKARSEQTTAALETAEVTAVEIEAARDAYRGVAERGARVFMAVTELARVDPLYGQGLETFTALFVKTLRRTENDDVEDVALDSPFTADDEFARAVADADAEPTDGGDARGGDGERGGSPLPRPPLLDPQTLFGSPGFEHRSGGEADAATTRAKRCKHLVRAVTASALRWSGRALLPSHRMALAVSTAAAVVRADGLVTDGAWTFLLRGVGDVTATRYVENPAPEWLADTTWEALLVYTEVHAASLIDLPALVAGNIEEWRQYITADPPDAVVPDDFENVCAESYLPAPAIAYHSLVLAATFRPDTVTIAAELFIETVLGHDAVAAAQPSPLNLRELYDDSSSTTPLVLFVAAGSDPGPALRALAASGPDDVGRHVDCIGMGAGQAEKAAVLVQRAVISGGWVCLENCHVAPELMPAIEELALTTIASEPHADFRLWITTRPDPALFPVVLARNGLTALSRPPDGLRANIADAFSAAVDQDVWGHPPLAPDAAAAAAAGIQVNVARGAVLQWRALVYGVVFLHCVAQGRARFGPAGWNAPYTWGASDLDAAIATLHDVFAANADGSRRGSLTPLPSGRRDSLASNQSAGDAPPSWAVMWDAVHHMVGRIVYGGRVTDAWDQRILDAVVKATAGPHTEFESLDEVCFFGSTDYGLPPIMGDITAVYEHAQGLPESDPADVFGLHHNHTVAACQRDASALIDVLVEAQPKTMAQPSVNATQSRIDVSTAGVADSVRAGSDTAQDDEIGVMVSDLRARLPGPMSVSTMHPETARDGESIHAVGDKSAAAFIDGTVRIAELGPIGVACAQEVARYNALLSLLGSRMTAVSDALLGLRPADDEITADTAALRFNRVPAAWATAYPSTLPLAAWFTDLSLRVQFIRDWLAHGPPPSYWLGGLCNPRGLLTSVQLAQSDARSIPVTDLVWHIEPLTDPDPNVALHDATLPAGIYIHGLVLEGAAWDPAQCVLCEPRPREHHTPLPVAALLALPSAEAAQRGRLRRQSTVGAEPPISIPLATDGSATAEEAMALTARSDARGARGEPAQAPAAIEYECPVYHTEVRGEGAFIAAFPLPVLDAQEASRWVLGSVSLLTTGASFVEVE